MYTRDSVQELLSHTNNKLQEEDLDIAPGLMNVVRKNGATFEDYKNQLKIILTEEEGKPSENPQKVHDWVIEKLNSDMKEINKVYANQTRILDCLRDSKVITLDEAEQLTKWLVDVIFERLTYYVNLLGNCIKSSFNYPELTTYFENNLVILCQSKLSRDLTRRLEEVFLKNNLPANFFSKSYEERMMIIKRLKRKNPIFLTLSDYKDDDDDRTAIFFVALPATSPSYRLKIMTKMVIKFIDLKSGEFNPQVVNLLTRALLKATDFFSKSPNEKASILPSLINSNRNCLNSFSNLDTKRSILTLATFIQKSLSGADQANAHEAYSDDLIYRIMSLALKFDFKDEQFDYYLQAEQNEAEKNSQQIRTQLIDSQNRSQAQPNISQPTFPMQYHVTHLFFAGSKDTVVAPKPMRTVRLGHSCHE